MRSHFIIIILLSICVLAQGQSEEHTESASSEGIGTALSKSEEAAMSVAEGQDFHNKASYDDALKAYFHALEIYDELLDSSHLAITLTKIGQTYLRIGKNDDAEQVFNRSLQISTLLNDKQGIQISTADVAIVWQRRNETQRAIKMFKKALVLAREVSNLKEEAIITGNIGSTFRREASYDSSIHYLLKALPLKVALGNGTSTAHTLNDIAQTYYDWGDYHNAVKYGQMALDTAEIADAVSQYSYAKFTLSRAYAGLKQYEAAYQCLNQHMQLADSINSVAKDRTISDLRIKYETGKKEQQIAELASENLRSHVRRRNLLIALFVVIAISLSIYYTLLSKRRHDKAIIAKTIEFERARSTFFANISHEFRTPLTLILGPLHALREKFSDTKTDSRLYGIQQNAVRLLRLIDSMLDLSKIDDHRLILNVSEVDAIGLIRDILTTIQHTAEQQHIEIEFFPADKTMPLYLDRDRFESIMLNILSNALKYSSDGDRITIRTSHPDDDRAYIEIQDTGEGIEEEDLPHIFERYHYNDKKSHSSLKGVGIGLALCKSLVELHGGHINVKSEVGRGTTFTVQFQLGKTHLEGRDDVLFSQADILMSQGDGAGTRDVDVTRALRTNTSGHHAEREKHMASEDHSALGNHSTSEGQVTSGNHELSEDGAASGKSAPTILIVEDRKDMRTFIKEILQDEFAVLESPDGVAGLEHARETIPDLIISDVMMPKMEGTELCALLKKDTRTSHIPVILLTAKSSDQDRLDGLETEADVYLTKPFIPKELILNIRNLLASRTRLHEYYAANGKLKSNNALANSTDDTFLTNLSQVLEKRYPDSGFSVEQLAEAAHMSRSQLHRKLTALTGQSPSSFIRRYRLQRALDLVQASAGTVSEIAFQVGFNSSSYFIKCFHKEFGASPGEIKAGN